MRPAVLAGDTAELLPLLTKMGLGINAAIAAADPPMQEKLYLIACSYAGFYEALGMIPPEARQRRLMAEAAD